MKDYIFSVENENNTKIIRVRAESEKSAREIVAEEYSTCNASLIEFNNSEIETIYSFDW
jgi:hypothetical protein